MNNYQMTPYDQQQMGWMSGMGGAPNPPYGQQFNQGYPPPQARQRFPPKQEIVDYIRGNLFGDEPVTVNLIERDWDRDYIPHFCILSTGCRRILSGLIYLGGGPIMWIFMRTVGTTRFLGSAIL